MPSVPLPVSRMLAGALLMGALAGCVGAPTSTATTGLAPGLMAEIATPGAQMDRGAALNIVNQYRGTRGAGPLTADAALDAQAETLARQYAASGTPPTRPADSTGMRLSAGYTNFANTFSGWRNSPADADVMAQADARRVGFAAVVDPNSAYGTHWVMLLGR